MTLSGYPPTLQTQCLLAEPHTAANFHMAILRRSTSALVGDPDLYPWVFQIQNAIPGSVWFQPPGDSEP